MKKTLVLLSLSLLTACYDDPYKAVGAIPFDEAVDDENFQLCDEGLVRQYYGRYASDEPAGYKGEKRGLEAAFSEKYAYPVVNGENGYVTIRFMVNCEGKSGRFRVEEMGFDNEPKTFDPALVRKLLDITKALDGWIPVKRKGNPYDFYQYLTFVIRNGQIEKIMP